MFFPCRLNSSSPCDRDGHDNARSRHVSHCSSEPARVLGRSDSLVEAYHLCYPGIEAKRDPRVTNAGILLNTHRAPLPKPATAQRAHLCPQVEMISMRMERAPCP